MSLKNTQNKVAEFVNANGLVSDPVHITLDLVSELGEIAKEISKGSAYGKKKLVLPAEFSEEIGDVLFALINLGNSAHVDLDDALQSTIAKMDARIKSKGHPGSE